MVYNILVVHIIKRYFVLIDCYMNLIHMIQSNKNAGDVPLNHIVSMLCDEYTYANIPCCMCSHCCMYSSGKINISFKSQ